MKIRSDRQDRTIHSVKIDEDGALRTLAYVVAQKAGVDLDAAGVTWRAYITSNSGGIGSTKYEVTVEIIEDHAAATAAV